MSSNIGIDYGMGRTNIDTRTGIRYGVIHQHEVLQAWCDSSEADYGAPHCPKCGNDPVGIDDDRVPYMSYGDPASREWEVAGNDHACLDCKYCFDSSEAYGDEPLGFTLDDGEYKATAGGDGDIFILSSPYYTLCQYCSPCAPGAGYVMNSVENGVKAYCFGHDWFDDQKAPYPVYSVATNELIEP